MEVLLRLSNNVYGMRDIEGRENPKLNNRFYIHKNDVEFKKGYLKSYYILKNNVNTGLWAYYENYRSHEPQKNIKRWDHNGECRPLVINKETQIHIIGPKTNPQYVITDAHCLNFDFKYTYETPDTAWSKEKKKDIIRHQKSFEADVSMASW